MWPFYEIAITTNVNSVFIQKEYLFNLDYVLKKNSFLKYYGCFPAYRLPH